MTSHRVAVRAILAVALLSLASASSQAEVYEGQYCSGTGNVGDLQLIDQSFAFFHANPNVPNLTMLYQPDWNTFEEGAGWGAWWIQNSYGFSYAAIPFLPEPWFTTLQNSGDLFWSNQGDGTRAGLWGGSTTASPPISALVAPDGCLGDCAKPGEIVYKQGDGNVASHDWFHEATAAGVVVQAEILLAQRDRKAIAQYLPKLERACDSIERTRDPKNSLFLVGPAANLLAPSFGGVRQPDGSFGKSYLAGLSINYLAAVGRMVELYKLSGNPEKQSEYERRAKITRESLPQLMTPAGYFVKSVEPGGLQHGVLGQKQFGYLEGVANADALAFRIGDEAAARTLYRQIAAFPAIRPFDFLLTNAPGLDDTYVAYGSTTPENIFQYGCWVNGGVWGTVEGRAILGYYRVGAFDDVRRSATRALKWAQEFRMDDHFTQCGENSDNLWYDKPPHGRENVAITIDNFAIPAATIRGLFDYDYRADGLILRPRVPHTITEYIQKEPIRFGAKKIFLRCRNGGMKIAYVSVNGKQVGFTASAVVLKDADLPAEAKVEIVTEGGWLVENSPANAPATPGAQTIAADPKTELPQSLRKPHAVLTKFQELLAQEPNVAEYDRAFIHESLATLEAWRTRTALEPQGYFRPMTPAKRDLILKQYENAAVRVYKGLAQRMARNLQNADAGQKRLGELFQQASQ